MQIKGGKQSPDVNPHLWPVGVGQEWRDLSGERHSFQQMELGQLDSHMRENNVGARWGGTHL